MWVWETDCLITRNTGMGETYFDRNIRDLDRECSLTLRIFPSSRERAAARAGCLLAMCTWKYMYINTYHTCRVEKIVIKKNRICFI